MPWLHGRSTQYSRAKRPVGCRPPKRLTYEASIVAAVYSAQYDKTKWYPEAS
jgi:hypothetical protein